MTSLSQGRFGELLHVFHRSQSRGIHVSTDFRRFCGVPLRFRIFRPWPDDNLRLTTGDDVARGRSIFIRGETADVVSMTMRGDYGMQFPIACLLNVFSDT